MEIHPAHTISYYISDREAEIRIYHSGGVYYVQYIFMSNWRSVGYYYTQATANRALAVWEDAKKSGAEKVYLPREGSVMFGDYILESAYTLKKYIAMLDESPEEAEQYRQKIIDDHMAEYEKRCQKKQDGNQLKRKNR